MESLVKYDLPEEVKSLMEQYVNGLQDIFSNEKIIGVYVYGSIALGAFHIETSDIDFVTVTKEPINEAEKIRIMELHKALNKSTLGKRMDGMYIPLVHLGKRNEEMPPYVYCADGKIHNGHWDVNAVTWWMLKHHGITVTGKGARELSLQVEWRDVIETMKYNVEQYWSQKAAHPYLFFSDEWVESAVVTIGRIVYTLENRTIVSKDAGLVYMKKSSKEWEPLLQEVQRIRDGKGKRSMSRWSRMKLTRRYVLDGIAVCKQKLARADMQNS